MVELTDAQWITIVRLGGANWSNSEIASHLNQYSDGPEVSAGIVGDRRRDLEDQTKNGDAEAILREIAVKGEVDSFFTTG